MTTFMTVLRSGGRYDPAWARALFRGIRRHDSRFREFILLTDLEVSLEGARTEPLRHGWPGWWSKIEAFRPGLAPGPIVLCDLDSMVSGPLDGLHGTETLAMEDRFHKGRISTALMQWPGDAHRAVYEAFAADPGRWMKEGSCGDVPNAVHGDQVVVDHFLRREGRMPAFVQHRSPKLLDFYAPKRGIVGPLTIFIGETKPVMGRDGELAPPPRPGGEDA